MLTVWLATNPLHQIPRAMGGSLGSNMNSSVVSPEAAHGLYQHDGSQQPLENICLGFLISLDRHETTR